MHFPRVPLPAEWKRDCRGRVNAAEATAVHQERGVGAWGRGTDRTRWAQDEFWRWNVRACVVCARA